MQTIGVFLLIGVWAYLFLVREERAVAWHAAGSRV
jgi:hypothetical protein